MTTGFLIDQSYFEHENPPGHPETKERLDAIEQELLKRDLKNSLIPIEAREASLIELTLVHDKGYIELVEKLSKGGGFIDLDTYVSKATFVAASRAAGGVINAVDAVLQRSFDNCFCAVRPPGHHARPRIGMGFCIFNNVAIAARHLEKMGIERIAIVDWDAHHGNGTQEIFYEDKKVLYISFHQYPHYPGTGAAEEIGRGDGFGYNINFPLPPGSNWESYAAGLVKVVKPVLSEFKPQFILISAGFDSHQKDPLSELHLTDDNFADMTRGLKKISRESGAGFAVVLEGGYDLRALGESATSVIEVLLDDGLFDPLENHSVESALFNDIVLALSSRWSSLR